MPQTIPNGNKIYKVVVKWTNLPENIQHISLQETPKLTQIGIFWFENIPSGNPALELGKEYICTYIVVML
jgi:hypothetical protein